MPTTAKRLHDTGKSSRWLLVGVVPLLGPLYLLYVLLLKGGTRKRNRYGNSLAEQIGRAHV